MTALEIQKFLRSKIALAEAMDARVVEVSESRFVVEAPLEANYNHLGTAFGGSIAALAMLAAYGMLWSRLGDSEVHLVIRESRIRYRRPIHSTLRAEALVPEAESLGRFLADFKKGGRPALPLTVLFPDPLAEPGSTKPAVLFTGVFVAV